MGKSRVEQVSGVAKNTRAPERLRRPFLFLSRLIRPIKIARRVDGIPKVLPLAPDNG
jgi:hypothetical protein